MTCHSPPHAAVGTACFTQLTRHNLCIQDLFPGSGHRGRAARMGEAKEALDRSSGGSDISTASGPGMKIASVETAQHTVGRRDPNLLEPHVARGSSLSVQGTEL